MREAFSDDINTQNKSKKKTINKKWNNIMWVLINISGVVHINIAQWGEHLPVHDVDFLGEETVPVHGSPGVLESWSPGVLVSWRSVLCRPDQTVEVQGENGLDVTGPKRF